MDAGKYIGRGIRALDDPEQPGEETGAGDGRDPHVRPVRENRTDQETDCHAAAKRDAEPGHFVRVTEGEIDDGSQNVDEPEQVGNDEDRQQRDQIIHGAVYDEDPGSRNNGILQVTEPVHIKQSVKSTQQIPVFPDQKKQPGMLSVLHRK